MADGGSRTKLRRIALIGNSPPRLCGIATFTDDVREAIQIAYPDVAIDVYAMNDTGGDHAYGPTVVRAIPQNDLGQYHLAAQQINDSGADVVLVQHEYGIFGGPAGGFIVKLLNRVTAPVVVTLHTVLESPDPDQRAVLEALARRAAQIIVMAEKGREILERVHGIAPDRIVVVPHGAPDRELLDSAPFKQRYGLASGKVLLTFGLLSPNKGIETIIRAMPSIIAAHPETIYIVLGATHPHLVAQQGEAYRESLIDLADELGVADNVRFVDGYLDRDALLNYLGAADIYVTPYLNEAQITSGTLSYAVALGKPVVSTPYWHASELLAGGVGIIAGFGDSAAFGRSIIALLDDEQELEAMRRRAWLAGRDMIWSRLADRYVAICRSAMTAKPVRLARPVPAERRELVKPRLDAVQRLSDGCGIIQHSIFGIPDRDHGYCVDDNCRALMLMHRMPDDLAEDACRLATVYASFVQHAWNGGKGRFRNFMAFDRSWLEEAGSEDSFGRSLWAIGATVVEARQQEMRRWALHLFDQVAPHSLALKSPRTWAFALLGADAVLDAHVGHGVAKALVADFGDRLLNLLTRYRRDDWIWFEPVLGYDNARLPEALIRAGHRLGRNDMLAAGTAALDWLNGVQRNSAGQFRAVGTDSFGREYGAALPFDQQPLEAWATIEANELAFRLGGERRWIDAALSAYRWYLGDNDLGLPIASVADGGCFDGLMSDRVNLNQGAESVLSFQFACCAIDRIGKAVGEADLGFKRDMVSRK